MPQKTSIFGLSENVVAALSYLFGPFSGIAVLVFERGNKFVRFHALQSTLWFLFLMVASWVFGGILSFIGTILGFIPLLGDLVAFLLSIILSPLSIIVIVLWVASKLLLMLRAYQGDTFKLPLVGDVVWTQIHK